LVFRQLQKTTLAVFKQAIIQSIMFLLLATAIQKGVKAKNLELACKRHSEPCPINHI